MHRQTQTELEHLPVKCTLINYPRGPNFGPFLSTISRFRDTCTRSAKIGNVPNDPQTDIEGLIVKGTLYTVNTYPPCPNFRPFCSTTSRFRDKRSSNTGNAPNDPKLNLNT